MADCPGGDHHGYYYCFGCGRGGTSTTLVCEVIGITWQSAQRWIAEHGLDVDAPAPLTIDLVVGKGMVKQTFSLPPGCHGGGLDSWPTPIRRYVASRGITAAQVGRWNLMYATAGLLEGRVVFPYGDVDGALVGYTARSWDGRAPRYREPHHSDGAQPWAMFGPINWPVLPEDRDVVVVAEGAINALALERAGARYIAAPGGSKSIVPQHVARLASFSEVIVASDNDQAGDAFAEELEAKLARWAKVRRLEFPKGVDAAQMDTDELRDRLERVSEHAARHGNRTAIPH